MRNYSFIIIAKPGQNVHLALNGLKLQINKLNSFPDVVIVFGSNPSLQRNMAAKNEDFPLSGGRAHWEPQKG